MRPDSQTSATLVVTRSPMGLRNARFRRAAQVPVLGIADDEIEDGLVGRELNHGGMSDARRDADDLIGHVVHAQHGRAAGFRLGGALGRRPARA